MTSCEYPEDASRVASYSPRGDGCRLLNLLKASGVFILFVGTTLPLRVLPPPSLTPSCPDIGGYVSMESQVPEMGVPQESLGCHPR